MELTFYSLVLIALALAMDAFAVSVTRGVVAGKALLTHALLLAIAFGAFQGIMPLIGWQLGMQIKHIVSSYDHWLAFVLLCGVGVKMCYEAKQKGHDGTDELPPLTFSLVLALAIATSIDALVVGLGFSFLKINIYYAALIIGVVTFLASFVGVFLGHCCCRLLGDKAAFVGGFVLILMGFKILLEHTM